MDSTTSGTSIETFLTTIFEVCDLTKEIPLLSKPNGDGFTNVVLHPNTVANTMQPGQDAWYFCVSTVHLPESGQAPSRQRDDLYAIYCLVCDDIGTKCAEPPVAPSWKLESSAGNFQWGYILDPILATPENIAKYEGSVIAIQNAGYSDAGAGGSYRIMRVPGSRHLTKDFVSRVTEWNPERFWSLDELMDDFGLEPVKQRAHTPRDRDFEAGTLEECEDPILNWLVAEGLYINTNTNPPGTVQIVCPWHGGHTNEEQDPKKMEAMYSPRGMVPDNFANSFSCFHDHCKLTHKKAQFLAWVVEQGGPNLAEITPPAPQVQTQQMAQPSGYTPPRDLDEHEQQHLRLLRNDITEDGVALFMATVLAGEFQYAHGRDTWLRWDGSRWRADAVGGLVEAVRHYTRDVNQENQKTAARKAFFGNVAGLMSTDGRCSRLYTDYDRDNYLLCTPGGIVDLRTGELRDAVPEDMVSYQTNVTPSDMATPVFDQFMLEVTDGDLELIEYHQRALGSMLSGAIEDHWMTFWIGSGRNGKNTLGDLFEWIMGDYATTIPAATLMTKKNDAHPTEIMAMKGRRLVVSSEVEDGAYWAESRLNQVTGDATLVGRFMNKDFVTFQRTHKHLVYGNHKPQLRNVTPAIMSRLKIVPFKVSFVGREDRAMPDKLRAEAAGVLSWLIEGHALWLANGRKVGGCTAVDDASAEYFSSQSSLDMWIEECLNVTEDDDLEGMPRAQWASAKSLYESYRVWKADRGEAPLSMNRLSDQLSTRYKKMRVVTGYIYLGLKLRPPGQGIPELNLVKK